MKKIKIAAVLGAAALLTGCIDISQLMEIENEYEPPVKPVSNNMPQVECVADELADSDWYLTVCENLLLGEEKTIVPLKLRGDDVNKALYQIHNDFPQISWLGQLYHAATVTNGSEVVISFLDDFDSDDIPKILKEIDDAADNIIKEIPEGSDDYEKALYVHDYIIEHTKYDHAGADSDERGWWGSAYGCLVEGKAVCSGYAEAFLYVMQKLGIESGVCTGSRHEWNYVKIDGEYYWLDATWDDMDKGEPQHTYFLFTTEQLLRTRTFDSIQSFIPECTAADSNYFVKNGGYFETYDEDAVLDYIGSCSDEGRCELMFGSFEAYEEALSRLIGKGKVYKADGVDLDNVNYSRSDQMFALDITY